LAQVYLRPGRYHIRLRVGFRIPGPSEELSWTRLASSALHDSRRPKDGLEHWKLFCYGGAAVIGAANKAAAI
jgi:hypothetical protein